MQINLLWCTIRTAQFPEFHNLWMLKAKDKNNIKTHILVSTFQEKDYLEKYLDHDNLKYRILIFKPDHPGVCLPSYNLASSFEYNSDDVIVFASDDFQPPQNWDEYLVNELKGKDGVLFVRDGYQLPDSSNMLYPAITIPIMTGSALTKMNKVIYHPSYSHMFSDCELYLTAKDLNILIDNRLSDSTTFEHHHWANHKRNPDINDQNYNNNWKEDEITWNKRKIMDVRDRLKINL